MPNSNESAHGALPLRPNSFYFDISGQTFEKTIVGSVGLADSQRGVFSRLRHHGRQLLTNRRLKSTKTDISIIRQVMDFLNAEKISMNAVLISTPRWWEFKQSYQNFGNWEERIYAYLYFEGFRHHISPGRGFNVFIDEDTFFDNDCAIRWLGRISKSNRYHPALAKGRVEYIEQIRLADVVCRAVRYLPSDELAEIENLTVLNNPSDIRILNHVFGIKEE